MILTLAACGSDDEPSSAPNLAPPAHARFGQVSGPPPTGYASGVAGAPAEIGEPGTRQEFDQNAKQMYDNANKNAGGMSGVLGVSAGAIRPLSGPIRAVLLGDSHSAGSFGQTLDKDLRNKGWDLSTYAVCGSSMLWWLGQERHDPKCGFLLHLPGAAPQVGMVKTPPMPAVANILKGSNANVFVFELGANSNGINQDVADGVKLMGMIPPESRCIWIGPPLMPSSSGEYVPIVANFYGSVFPRIIQASGRTCDMIDSRGLAHNPVGAHYDNHEGVKWARNVEALIAP